MNQPQQSTPSAYTSLCSSVLFPLQEQRFVAPDLLAIEVASVSRRMVLRGVCSAARAEQALTSFRNLPKTLYPTESVLRSAWDLRDNVSVADALYLVVAGALDATLVTTDERLARAARARAMHVASPDG